jgi:hypothetical protein
MSTPNIQPIPRLLLGATLLFWGSMIGFPVVGLLTALIIESPHWIRSRWNFNDSAVSRAVQLSFIFSVITAAFIWFDGNRYTALAKLLIWLPLLLFPIQFVQSFGFNNYINLKAFYLLLNKINKNNTYVKQPESIVRFNFGSAYFIAIIVASGLGQQAKHYIFFPGVLILTAWLIFSHTKARYFALSLLILIGSAIGIIGQIGMSELYEWATNRGLNISAAASAAPTINRTNIGSLGEIKQSSKIQWRVYPELNQSPPHLLRTASYNRYKGISWRNVYPNPIPSDEESYREISSLDLTENDSYYLMRENMSRSDLKKRLPLFEIRGALAPDSALPLPGNASTLQNDDFNEISINPMGTVRTVLEKPVTRATVRWNDTQSTEAPPYPLEDLAIDPVEWVGIHEVARALGLRELSSTQEKLGRLNHFFQTEFTYSRYLTIPRVHTSHQRPTAIEIFLTSDRSGHCEYFATAATLLLRAADVPARYTIGFSIMEKSPDENEWIARGTHAHAWTRVWDEQHKCWIDFDPTPGGWLVQETRAGSKYQWLMDAYQRIKEDFFLWRNQSNNRLGIIIGFATIGLGLLIYLIHRLRKSRVILQRKKNSSTAYFNDIKTPLHELEKTAQKLLPPRQPGETLATWLMGLQHHNIPIDELQLAFELHQQLRHDPAPQPAEKIKNLQAITSRIGAKL